jgi:Hemerythrin HHE cation binding domain
MSLPRTPHSLRREHEEMRQSLAQLTRREGALGDAARRLARVLEPHFRKEEAFAAPPLGALPEIARGRLNEDMRVVVAHGEWLRQNLDDMLAEHRMIAAAVEAMLQVAAGEPELVSFAEKLLNHARIEEEILYPAAILAGEFLKVRLGKALAHATT